MRLNGLRPVWKRKFVHTTDSKHTMPVSPNVLARQFEESLPNQAWVSDITHICTHSGWLYLAAVLDLHSRKIVAWAMSPEMPATLVCTALQMAIVLRSPTAGLVVHSDRGTQYASAMHQGWSESGKRTTPTTHKPWPMWRTTFLAFTTARDCIPNWGTCHPTPSSVNRQLYLLLMCPKLLDHNNIYDALNQLIYLF